MKSLAPLFVALLLVAAPTFAASKKPAPQLPGKPTAPPDVAKPPESATRSITGLLTNVLQKGSGTTTPAEDDFVKLRYAIFTSEGNLVDFTPAKLWAVMPLAKMIPGLREGVLGMHVGEKARFWIPERLGAAGRVPPGGMLVVDAELLDIIHPPLAPASVAKPPADAITTKSGLTYLVLRNGTDGAAHPKRSSTVTVHYTGWKTDGTIFDSSVLRGEPAVFPMDGIISGWREALMMMTPGERMRIWVPANLAYNNDPNKPQGTLVFDVELISFK